MVGPARPRRRPRDWAVDTLVFVVAVVSGLLLYSDGLTDDVSDGMLAADLVAGMLLCLALWWRRRWPVQLALAAAALSVFSEAAGGASLLAVLTVAIHRPLRYTLLVGAANVPGLAAYLQVRPKNESPTAMLVSIGLLYLATAGWGLYLRSRRQLLQSLKDRADRAETVARLQAEQAQLRAREEIAREMHDVLGHRLSLLSVHAGALAYRPDASTREVAGAAEVIRASAHQALQDLREVIGVLRAPVGELPQPTFADLPELVAGSRRAGLPIDLTVDAPGNLPDHVGRTAYRIVQEGLTNALKHAPGAPVRVRVAGAPGSGLSIEVHNPVGHAQDGTTEARTTGGSSTPASTAVGGAPANGAPRRGQPADGDPRDVTPSDGQGLVGLAERAALADGRLEHGRTADGDFRLAGWLPWPA